MIDDPYQKSNDKSRIQKVCLDKLEIMDGGKVECLKHGGTKVVPQIYLYSKVANYNS